MTTMTEEISEKLNVLPLKHEIPLVDAKEPWKDDKLQRKDLADAIIRMITGQDQPVVLAITGDWGSGKTFFLKRLQAEVARKGWQAIYYSAWEDDHVADPLISICGQMLEHFRNLKNFTEATNLFGRAAKRIASNSVSAATGGVISIDENTFRTPYGNLVGQYHDQLLARTALKERLETLSATVREETHGPLVFMLDELDRCRPNYAIETLERIKHLFSVPNVVFILGIDIYQLEKSIKGIYGEIDSREYLKRFVDFDIHLPSPDRKIYIKKLIEDQQLLSKIEDFGPTDDQTLKKRTESFIECLCELGVLLELNLRQIEHVLRRFVLTLYSADDRMVLHPELLALLIALRTKHEDKYRNLQKETVLELVQFLFENLQDVKKAERCPNWFVKLEAVLYSLIRDENDYIVPMKELTNFHYENTPPVNVARFRKQVGRKDLETCAKWLDRMHEWTSRRTLPELKEAIEATGHYVDV